MEKLGLRERKRQLTQTRLEDEAIRLVLRHGIDKVTVDMISEASNVSTRTFFNYFDSKEDALIGLSRCGSENRCTPGNAYSCPSNIIECIIGELVQILSPSIMDPEINKRRMRLARLYPQLLDKQIERMITEKEGLIKLIESRLKQQGQAPPGKVQAHAEVILMTCVGAIKAATKEWVGKENDKIVFDKIKQRATKLVSESIKVIQQ